jgi:hypothetical protein
MTQEEKKLLLRDLCTRLPYGVKANIPLVDGDERIYTVSFDDMKDFVEGYINIKPYLRQMSSMTEAEIEELKELTGTDEVKQYGFSYSGLIGECFGMMYDDCSTIVDWLNAHHFDYRGLIPMGLALEATENMYDTD